jgi:hypothetical protein
MPRVEAEKRKPGDGHPPSPFYVRPGLQPQNLVDYDLFFRGDPGRKPPGDATQGKKFRNKNPAAQRVLSRGVSGLSRGTPEHPKFLPDRLIPDIRWRDTISCSLTSANVSTYCFMVLAFNLIDFILRPMQKDISGRRRGLPASA